MLTTNDVARLLAVAPKRVRELVQAGELTAYRLGHRTARYNPDDVRRLLERRREP